jgi:hypothetical protein
MSLQHADYDHFNGGDIHHTGAGRNDGSDRLFLAVPWACDGAYDREHLSEEGGR